MLRQQRLEPPRDLANGYGQAEPTYENAPAVLTTQQAMEKFNSLLLELDRSISQNGNATLVSLPANHIVRALIRQVPLLVTQAANRDDCALLFSKRIIQQLYGSDNKLSREIYLLVLERLCEISKRFFKELKDWLLYDNDEVSRRYLSDEF
jgi:CCR4-NOT transcription complex subunit 1